MSETNWTYMGQIVEDGIYMLKDGELYKCEPRIRFPIAKSVNIVTGKVNYPTNGDRLRSMTEEELAEFLTSIRSELVCRFAENDECINPDKPCELCWLEWLREEVKDDGI